MAAKSFRRLAGALALALLALAPAALAAPTPWPPPTPAEEDAALWRMRVLIQNARKLVVTHAITWTDPAPFPTSRPCKVRSEGERSSRTVDAAWAQRFAACLALDSLAGPGGASCAGDSVRTDDVILEFGEDTLKVWVRADLGMGDVTISDAKNTSVFRLLGARTPGLRALVAEALPRDKRLAGAVTCDGSRLLPPDTTAAPRFGQFVYIEDLPEAVRKVPPAYPDKARELGKHGQVMVQALIGKDGRVQRMVIVDSIPVFDGPAAAAVEQWEFKPAMSHGKPIDVWVAIPVKFSLR